MYAVGLHIAFVPSSYTRFSTNMNSVSGLLLGLTAASFVTQADAFWRTACSVAQTGRIDPILSPGHISGHVHKLSGASSMVNFSVSPFNAYTPQMLTFIQRMIHYRVQIVRRVRCSKISPRTGHPSCTSHTATARLKRFLITA